MAIRILGSNYYTGFSKDNPPRTIDLTDAPVVIETAATLSIKETQIVQVTLSSTAEFYLTTAVDVTEATTRLNADATRALYPLGVWGLDISGIDDFIYIRSTTGGTVSKAVSLTFSERD